MKLPDLTKATLLKRYKRFLADIRLQDGHETTIHCANTGAMTGCADAGNNIWFSVSDNVKRKYPYSWELTETPQGDLICINTAMANKLAFEAVSTGQIAQLSDYERVQAEVKYGQENSRIDLLLTAQHKPDCYVEVKSVTLLANNRGYFPDAKTQRGQKHLRELMAEVEKGNRAVLLFVVLHSGIHQVAPAAHIDPAYAQLIDDALKKGVEILAYKADISPESLEIKNEIPFSSQ